MFVPYNPSPVGARVGDCAVRAVACALETDWDTAYVLLCSEGFDIYDLPNANAVIDRLLVNCGFDRGVVPNTCPRCMTVGEFADTHLWGVYVLCTGSHVVCVADGDVYDSWDSRGELPIFYWKRRD